MSSGYGYLLARKSRNFVSGSRRDSILQGYSTTERILAVLVRETNRDNSPLSEWIAYGFDITVLLVTERILPVFVKEAKVL